MSFEWSFILCTKSILYCWLTWWTKETSVGGLYVLHFGNQELSLYLPCTITLEFTKHITVNPVVLMLNWCLFYKEETIMSFYSVTTHFSSLPIDTCSSCRKRHFHPPLRHFITKQSWYSLSGDIFSHAIGR